MTKAIIAGIVVIVNFGFMGWLIDSNAKKDVVVAEQAISIQNGKEKIKAWEGLYDKKIKELKAKEEINKRMEDELKRIKDKVNKMGVGDRFNFSI